MITLTWGNLRDRDFMESMGKLCGKPMSYEHGSKIALVGREMKKQQKLCNETHDSLLKKFGTPDEKKPGVYTLHEVTRNEYAAEMTKLDAHEFTVNVNKIDASILNDAIELAPQDLILLEPLFLPLEERVAGKKPLASVPKTAPHPAS